MSVQAELPIFLQSHNAQLILQSIERDTGSADDLNQVWKISHNRQVPNSDFEDEADSQTLLDTVDVLKQHQLALALDR